MKLLKHKIIDGIELKKCSVCHQWIPIKEFHKNLERVDGLAIRCKTCTKEIGRKYYQKNKKKINTKNALWKIKNREKINKDRRKHYKRNKEKMNRMRSEWRKRNPEKYKKSYDKVHLKRKQNPKQYLSSKISSGIKNSIKKGSKNGRQWKTLVGYTIDQLIKHLKKTIPKGYTWQDYLDGKFHIDHKIPISVFNFETPEDIDFKKCWALKNLQLLPVKENLSKSNKIDKHFQPSLLLKV